MRRVKFTDGTKTFWVKDRKKIKFWERICCYPQSRVRKLKEEKQNG